MADQDLELEDRRRSLEEAFKPVEDSPSKGELMPVYGSQMEHVPLGAQRVAIMRDESKVLQRIKNFAQAAGDDFYYQWETKNRDGTKGVVEGASIQAALYVLRTFGNCDVDMRVQDIGTHWIMYARFTDFETGFRLTRAYQQRKDQSTGMKDKDRQLDIVFQIGQSKAIRNVVCNALRPFTDFAFEEAKGAIVEKVGKRLDFYRDKVLTRLAELKIDPARLERLYGRPIKEWIARDIAKAISELQSIADGMIGADDVWPPIVAAVSDQRPNPSDFKEGGKAEAQKTVDKPVETAKPAEAETAKVEPKTEPKTEEKKAEPDKPAETAKPAETTKAQDSYEDWKSDQLKRLARCITVPSIDDLEEEVLRDIDENDKKAWTDACNAKAREVMTAAKKKGR